MDKFLSLGNKIRQSRKDKGITQEDLAHLSGLDRSYVGYIERGEQNITLSTLFQISEALGVAASYLLEE